MFSGELRDYDFFGEQKRDTLEASLSAMELLGEHLLETVSDPAALTPDQVQRAFSDFIGVRDGVTQRASGLKFCSKRSREADDKHCSFSVTVL